MKILLEMRPALEGHAGIPQEVRLLFFGLSSLDGIAVDGPAGTLRATNDAIVCIKPPCPAPLNDATK